MMVRQYGFIMSTLQDAVNTLELIAEGDIPPRDPAHEVIGQLIALMAYVDEINESDIQSIDQKVRAKRLSDALQKSQERQKNFMDDIIDMDKDNIKKEK